MLFFVKPFIQGKFLKKILFLTILTLTQIQTPTHTMELTPEQTIKQQNGFEKFADLWKGFQEKIERAKEANDLDKPTISKCLNSIMYDPEEELDQAALDRMAQETLDNTLLVEDSPSNVFSCLLWYVSLTNQKRILENIQNEVNEENVEKLKALALSRNLRTTQHIAERREKIFYYIQQIEKKREIDIIALLLEREDDEDCRQLLQEISQSEHKLQALVSKGIELIKTITIKMLKLGKLEAEVSCMPLISSQLTNARQQLLNAENHEQLPEEQKQNLETELSNQISCLNNLLDYRKKRIKELIDNKEQVSASAEEIANDIIDINSKCIELITKYIETSSNHFNKFFIRLTLKKFKAKTIRMQTDQPE